MSSTEEFDDSYDPDEDPELADMDGEDSGSKGAFGRTFGELPEGYVTAGGFAKIVEEQRGVKVRPQVFYAAAKNSKTFPATHNDADGRIIVHVEEALKWWDEKEKRSAGRAGGGTRSQEPTAYEKAQAATSAE